MRNAFAFTAYLSVCTFLIQSPARGHDHPDHDKDDRVTPREAATHETGQLPPAAPATQPLESVVKFSIVEQHRVVTANGIPSHEPGQFPNRGNPNIVSEQQYTFRLPLDPARPTEPIDIHTDRGYLFGIALNGVPFEPATGLNWTPDGLRRGGQPGPWVYEAVGGSINFGIDHANAHVQRTGAYHYHGIPAPLIEDDQPTLLGYAADGYPIYGPLGYEDPTDAKSPLIRLQSSWVLKTDPRPDGDDGPGGTPDGRFTADWVYDEDHSELDQLNGRFAVTPEYPKGVYHYILTDTFPHIPRGFAGDPDRSFRRQRGQGPNHVTNRNDRLPLGERAED